MRATEFIIEAANPAMQAAIAIAKKKKKKMSEGSESQLDINQLAAISDAALDAAYGYGRSSPGNTFGWQANLKSAAYAKQMIDRGVTDIEVISDAIHKGWNITASAFVQDPDQFDDTEKLKAAGKLEAKLQQREKLMNIGYSQLSDDEQEKDRVVARALLQALTGQQGVAEGYNDLGPEYGGAGRGRSADAMETAKLTRQAKAAAAKAGKTFNTSAEYRLWHMKQKSKKQGVAEGDSGAKYKVRSIGHDAKGDYYISPSTGKKVYKKGAKVGDHENPKTGEHKGVAEDDTHQIKGNELIEYLMKRFEMTREQAIELLKKKGLAEDWQKVNHHDKTDGMSGKAVKAYRRENPGSKLKTAVTTKPSKLKKGGKAASRRKSFCARMGGMKKHNAGAKTKRDPDSPINKALRRWNCESVEQLQDLVMLAEQFVQKSKK